MILRAYAKVNLSLDVIGKREDGYHLLKMIMQQIDLYDTITIHKNNTGNINITCNKSYVPIDERNLAHKAAKLFMNKYGVEEGVDIDIEKNIPVSAGLAGGSTDAATVLKAMRALFKGRKISNKDLKKLGLRLGADIPYCIEGGTALCEGIGEQITPLRPFSNLILVLVKPNFGVSTRDVYKALQLEKIYRHPNTNHMIKAIKEKNLESLVYNMRNVLENVTVGSYPTISFIKKEMIRMGAKGALMSGSGPTVFGIFEDMLSAQRAYENFKKYYTEVFITRTL